MKHLMPPTYFILLLVLSVFSYISFPMDRIISSPYAYAGFFFIALGAMLNIWADLIFKKSKTTLKPFGKPSSLVVSGPFKISRHPMYLGMTAILLGMAIAQGTILGFLFPVLFVIIMEAKFIEREEIDMEKIFGEKYKEYKKKVRRWI